MHVAKEFVCDKHKSRLVSALVLGLAAQAWRQCEELENPVRTMGQEDEVDARWGAGAVIAVVPLFGAGVEGQVTDAFRFAEGEGVSTYNLIATLGTLLLFLGIVLTIGNLIRSRVEEPLAPPDPWLGETLEWLALSPPPPHNFDELPDVRSDVPLTDIREVLTRIDRERDHEARETEPVA